MASNRSRLMEKSSKIGERPVEKKSDTPPPMTMPGKMLLFQDELGKMEVEKNRLLATIDLLQKTAFEIEIDEIVQVEGRRRYLTDDQFNDLLENLRNNDLVHPIVVRKLSTGKYELIAGHNRVACYKHLGRAKILAINKDYDETKAVKASLYSNLLSPSLLDYEKYKGLKHIRDLEGLTNTELASESGISKSSVSFLFSFEKLSENALVAVESDPSLFKARAVYDIVSSSEKAKVDSAFLDEIFKKMARQEMTAEQALSSFEKKPQRVSPMKETLDVRSGKTKVCTIMKVGNSVRLVFKNEQDIPEGMLEKIKTLIEEGVQ